MNNITRHNIYIAPDGFLDSFDEKVISISRRRAVRMPLISSISLAAAVVVCALTGGVAYKLSSPHIDEHHVARAFCQLSEEDREFLIETDDCDIFLNL